MDAKLARCELPPLLAVSIGLVADAKLQLMRLRFELCRASTGLAVLHHQMD